MLCLRSESRAYVSCGEKKGFGKHNRSLPRFSSPGLEDLVQGEGREERNDGGDSGPDKPGTSVRVFPFFVL